MAIESSRVTAQPFPGLGSPVAGVPAVPDGASIGLPEAEEQDEAEASEEEENAPLLEEPKYGSRKERLVSWVGDNNLARYIDRQTLGTIGELVVREFNIDENSRADWKDEAEKALEFATQKTEAKQYPWQDASNIIFPLITTAAFQFSAMSYPALIDGRNVAKGVVWGDDSGTPATKDGSPNSPPVMGADGTPVMLDPPGAKQLRADRIGEHMSWQLLEQMEEWEPQTDSLLMQLPIIGGAARKTFRDHIEKENRSLLVSLLDLVWNKNAPSFERAPRHTEILSYYPHEVEEFERADHTFLPLVYGAEGDEDGEVDPSDMDAPRIYLEQHRRYDLDGDGYPEPVIVTVHKQSKRVVRIVARYDEDGVEEDPKYDEITRIVPTMYYTLYPFLPNPKGGSYPIGFGHLLKPLNEAINTTLNQMFDAGHLQIAGGGFIGTSLSIHSGPVNFQIGEYKPVNNKGQNIRDAVFPIPFPGPSGVLFQLLGFLVQAAKETASIQNILSGDATLANVQPTTLLALIEQGMKLYTAIYKRIYRAMKSELNKLYRLNRLYVRQDVHFRVGDSALQVSPKDYQLGGGVKPGADPNMVTDMQKITRAMILREFAADPLCNPIEIRRRIFEAARIEHIDKVLVTTPPGPGPKDQLEMALSQANLGRARAAEQKDATQAVLNLALAAKAGDAKYLGWYEQQINLIRTHIEALNTTVKAADVDAKFHGHNMRLKQTGAEARDTAHETHRIAAGGPSAGEPGTQGPNGGSGGPMAPPSGNSVLPAFPGAPGGQLPAGPPANLGAGGPQ